MSWCTAVCMVRTQAPRYLARSSWLTISSQPLTSLLGFVCVLQTDTSLSSLAFDLTRMTVGLFRLLFRWSRTRYLTNSDIRRVQSAAKKQLPNAYKKAVLLQRLPRNTPHIMGALKIFGTPWLCPQLLFPKFIMGFCSDSPYECAYKI